MGALERIEDARFLWDQGRRGSGLLLVCAAVAARARREYPEARDGDGFRRLIRESLSARLSVEFRGEQRPIEQLLYRWVRCELVHNASVPLDIEIDDDLGEGLTVRAGGAPDFLLKLSPGWFDFLSSVAIAGRVHVELPR
jgi:hypothetical protein